MATETSLPSALRSCAPPAAASRTPGAAICDHEGFHAIRTAYDRRRGLLVFRWTCEGCGALLGEVRRERYRPAYDPRSKGHLGGHRTVPR